MTNGLVVFFGGKERVEVVRVEQIITVGNQIEKLVERLRPFRDDLGFEVADQNFLWEHEVTED